MWCKKLTLGYMADVTSDSLYLYTGDSGVLCSELEIIANRLRTALSGHIPINKAQCHSEPVTVAVRWEDVFIY